MMWTYILALTFLSLVVARAQPTVTVQTRVGTVVGFREVEIIDNVQRTVSKFFGIPYAESTAGKNRFQKPIPKAPLYGVFDARNKPMACYQSSPDSMKEVAKRVPGFSEDCLTLNIYVPHDMQSKDLLPVMVWIHGGGFVEGAASDYNPEALSIIGNVVVVTVNYRLGMFGFLRDESGDFPGNQGLWDQHLALKWVHKNIDHFNGHKDEVTIFGNSAGGASVLFQAMYAGNRGLFKRVIAQSGSPLAEWATAKASFSEIYLNRMGCPSGSNRLACMQAKSPAELIVKNTSLAPIVDGDFLVQSPLVFFFGNDSKSTDGRNFYGSLDIMSGVNDMDGILYYLLIGRYFFGTNESDYNISAQNFSDVIIPLLYPVELPEKYNMILNKMLRFEYINWTDPEDFLNIRKSSIRLYNDGGFFAPAIAAAQTHASLKAGGSSYFYEFAVNSENHVFPVPPSLTGSNHGDELFYVLGLPLSQRAPPFGAKANYTDVEKTVSHAVMTMWSNFAKSGNPNVPVDLGRYINTTWPAYNMTSQKYFQISNHMSSTSVQERFHVRSMSFWNDVVYPLTLKLAQKCEV